MKTPELITAIEAEFAFLKMRIPDLNAYDKTLFEVAFTAGCNFILQEMKKQSDPFCEALNSGNGVYRP